MDRLIVTMDGPAGSGKSSVARTLAQRLGVAFLDTGAMYRGVAVAVKQAGIDPNLEPNRVAELVQSCTLAFDWSHDPPQLHVDGENVADQLRTPDVTRLTSELAAMKCVREVLVREQQRIGKTHPRLVTEGRDQGSVVFPEAQVKFYLEASADVRAKRRAIDLEKAGVQVDLTQLREQILDRDHRDTTRKDGPLICPEDAVRVDTSDMTQAQVVDKLYTIVQSRMANANQGVTS